eukprot:NODE_21426_length_754_cov_1.913876.p1 GENE.NODE_21426_length_754_cov_1.913876~~NODE_21426_length_754_cov_1.913876.p1  ORF type:complete len:147 (-),score=53.05 NODE_21426_length_754_cov_1.913876:313-753(-)
MSQHPMATRPRALPAAPGTRLFVSRIAPGVKKTDIQQVFGEFGQVVDIELPMTAKGVAFVQYDSVRDARDAMEEVTGQRLKGFTLKVTQAALKPDRPAVPEDQLQQQQRRPQSVLNTANMARDDRRDRMRVDKQPPRERDRERDRD